jgi:hypothetical protein
MSLPENITNISNCENDIGLTEKSGINDFCYRRCKL